MRLMIEDFFCRSKESFRIWKRRTGRTRRETRASSNRNRSGRAENQRSASEAPEVEEASG